MFTERADKVLKARGHADLWCCTCWSRWILDNNRTSRLSRLPVICQDTLIIVRRGFGGGVGWGEWGRGNGGGGGGAEGRANHPFPSGGSFSSLSWHCIHSSA